jgi:hypothetical protein
MGEDDLSYIALRSGNVTESDGKQLMRKGTGTIYRIVVRSELNDKYAVAFEGMEMETKDGDTVLKGKIIDQPHLHGILARINGLGLRLLSVEALPDDVDPSSAISRGPKGSEL